MKTRMEIITDSKRCTIRLSGPLLVDTIAQTEELFRDAVEKTASSACTIDLQKVDQIDSAGAIMIAAALDRLKADSRAVSIACDNDAVLRMIDLVKSHRHPSGKKLYESKGFLETIGEESMAKLYQLFGLMAFIGEAFTAVARLFRTPFAFRWRETMFQINESAIKALWIIALTMFLIGIVVAYQSAVQLKMYGANIFIVDMLGISIMRELAPMLTAIVVAGRSGSAYAAQIGVMKITEELDAMRTMGFDPFAFLILPRVFALIIMMPVLIFFADIMGIIGGMVIANTQLDLTPQLFMDRFSQVIEVKHFWVGIVKGPFFAILIASIGLYRGLLVKNDTESIGFNTTKSVVESIFAVIICDALFSIFFTEMGF